VPQPIVSSGRIAVKVAGKNCSGWGWAQIEVWAKTSVTTQALRAGDPILPAVTIVEREILSGRAPFVPGPGAVAGRSLRAGTVLCANDASGSAAVAGESVKVLIASGLVAIETQGRRISCASSRACAVLSTGKHVEGRWDDRGRLIVEISQ
jgi:flagella basal body P-ring formation protein FlgA